MLAKGFMLHLGGPVGEGLFYPNTCLSTVPRAYLPSQHLSQLGPEVCAQPTQLDPPSPLLSTLSIAQGLHTWSPVGRSWEQRQGAIGWLGNCISALGADRPGETREEKGAS